MKHAFLIMVHNSGKVLHDLILLLDHKDNDIYIHVDAKTKNFDNKEYEKLVTNSKIYFTERTKVYWGDYSQINAELILLKSAIRGGYSYYHLLSGQDLPLFNHSAFDEFFTLNDGKEFVHVSNDFRPISKNDLGGVFNAYSRLSLYHFGIKNWRTNKFLKAIEYVSILIQYKIGIDRIKNKNVKIYWGANWFSITNNAAEYVVSQETKIISVFGRWTRCADELFLQTVLMNSQFKKMITGDNLRYVRFNGSRPYTWQLKDENELFSSGKLFARKFNGKIDEEIINRIFKRIR